MWSKVSIPPLSSFHCGCSRPTILPSSLPPLPFHPFFARLEKAKSRGKGLFRTTLRVDILPICLSLSSNNTFLLSCIEFGVLPFTQGQCKEIDLCCLPVLWLQYEAIPSKTQDPLLTIKPLLLLLFLLPLTIKRSLH